MGGPDSVSDSESDPSLVDEPELESESLSYGRKSKRLLFMPFGSSWDDMGCCLGLGGIGSSMSA